MQSAALLLRGNAASMAAANAAARRAEDKRHDELSGAELTVPQLKALVSLREWWVRYTDDSNASAPRAMIVTGPHGCGKGFVVDYFCRVVLRGQVDVVTFDCGDDMHDEKEAMRVAGRKRLIRGALVRKSVHCGAQGKRTVVVMDNADVSPPHGSEGSVGIALGFLKEAVGGGGSRSKKRKRVCADGDEHRLHLCPIIIIGSRIGVAREKEMANVITSVRMSLPSIRDSAVSLHALSVKWLGAGHSVRMVPVQADVQSSPWVTAAMMPVVMTVYGDVMHIGIRIETVCTADLGVASDDRAAIVSQVDDFIAWARRHINGWDTSVDSDAQRVNISQAIMNAALLGMKHGRNAQGGLHGILSIFPSGDGTVSTKRAGDDGRGADEIRCWDEFDAVRSVVCRADGMKRLSPASSCGFVPMLQSVLFKNIFIAGRFTARMASLLREKKLLEDDKDPDADSEEEGMSPELFLVQREMLCVLEDMADYSDGLSLYSESFQAGFEHRDNNTVNGTASDDVIAYVSLGCAATAVHTPRRISPASTPTFVPKMTVLDYPARGSHYGMTNIESDKLKSRIHYPKPDKNKETIHEQYANGMTDFELYMEGFMTVRDEHNNVVSLDFMRDRDRFDGSRISDMAKLAEEASRGMPNSRRSLQMASTGEATEVSGSWDEASMSTGDGRNKLVEMPVSRNDRQTNRCAFDSKYGEGRHTTAPSGYTARRTKWSVSRYVNG